MTGAAPPLAPGAAGWLGGAALSLALHGAVLGVLVLALAPTPFPAPPRPPVQVQVRSEPVTRGSANPVAPDAPQAPSRAMTGARTAASGVPPAVRADPVAPDAARAEPVAPPAPVLAPDIGVATPLPATAATSQPVPALAPALKLVPAGRLPVPTPLAAAAPPATPLASTPAPPDTLPPATAPVTATRAAPAAPVTAATAPGSLPAPAIPLPSERQTAALVPDATGLLPAEALAAFLRPGDIVPGDAGALAVRDGIAATLAQFPCSRIQSGFNPDTGSLDLRGHVPDPAMRAVVTDSLQAQLGPGVPITGELLILPRPQCQMLAALDALGLPQSTEQYTNPRVIGPDAHVRDYRFVEGDRLVLDLTAPDYPAWILVDYYDAQGQVLHLQPNSIVPAKLAAPKSALSVGRAEPGQPSLDITISPPFGQEIAVALAVSAPLMLEDRPLIEPAAPYLAALAERLRAARAADPAFKGEWVYFFVTTVPR